MSTAHQVVGLLTALNPLEWDRTMAFDTYCIRSTFEIILIVENLIIFSAKGS